MIKELNVAMKRETISLIANITYKNEQAWYGATERPMSLSLYVPKNREAHRDHPMPLLVWLCGGALMMVDNNIWMPQLLSFAEQGFIVASVEYRTCNNMPLPGAMIDVKAAIRYLKAHARQYCIDPENVFIMGESAGGMIAALVGVTNDDPEYEQGDYLNISSSVRGVIDLYGMVDFPQVIADAPRSNVSIFTRLAEIGLTPDSEDKGNLDRFSAIRYVNENTVPFLIMHGTADKTIFINQSEMMHDRLTACGVPCEFYRLIGCTHGADHFYQPAMIDIMIEFMKKHRK